MRTKARTDANQKAIVTALRRIGASVAVTSGIGNGFPDIVVGYRGRNYLIEIKDGDKPPSKRKLTPDEAAWHEAWRGEVMVVESVDDALAALNLIKVKAKNMQTESASVKKGEYIVLKEGGTVYQFEGWGRDVIYVKDAETGEELELSWY